MTRSGFNIARVFRTRDGLYTAQFMDFSQFIRGIRAFSRCRRRCLFGSAGRGAEEQYDGENTHYLLYGFSLDVP